jgi:hypothetical protein
LEYRMKFMLTIFMLNERVAPLPEARLVHPYGA